MLYRLALQVRAALSKLGLLFVFSRNLSLRVAPRNNAVQYKKTKNNPTDCGPFNNFEKPATIAATVANVQN